MRYLSVCSGIEAATVAWHPLGWTPVGFAEIDKFPSAVLAHHYGSNMPGDPLAKNGVPNHGDFTKISDEDIAAIGHVDILVGGTPCQSFSIAGRRLGLDDPRGNLALEYLALARRLRARWIVWENVPGVLSSRSEDGTDDFGTFLSFVRECGYGFAYRVLDAQYVRVDGFPFAVPQRRRRVFLVGYLGDWRRSAAVLFEPEGMRWDSPPRRKAGQGVAPTIASRPTGGGGLGTDFDCNGGLIANSGDVSYCVSVNGQRSNDAETETIVAHALRAEGFDASEDGTGRGTPIVPIDMRQASRGATMTNNRAHGQSGGAPGTGIGEIGDPAPTIAGSHIPAIAFPAELSGTQVAAAENLSPALSVSHTMAVAHTIDQAQGQAIVHAIQAGALRENPNAGPDGVGVQEGAAYTLEARAEVQAVQHAWAVRRLTPRECERLQGFPDDYTAIPWGRGPETPDGPRYKALGNSMAVNVMRWIGQRIDMLEKSVGSNA